MTFDEYQIRTEEFAVYEQKGDNIIYPFLGVLGEVGEMVALLRHKFVNHKELSGELKWIDAELSSIERFKKFFRKKGVPKEIDRKELHNSVKELLLSEMGDVLWYLAALARELNVSFDVIAYDNIVKLKERKQQGELVERKGETIIRKTKKG